MAEIGEDIPRNQKEYYLQTCVDRLAFIFFIMRRISSPCSSHLLLGSLLFVGLISCENSVSNEQEVGIKMEEHSSMDSLLYSSDSSHNYKSKQVFPYNPPVQLGTTFYQDVNQAIQEASEGDSIFFSPGLYSHSILVQSKKNLSLIGSGSGTYIHIPEANVPIVHIDSSSNIGIHGLFLRHDVPREACFGPGNSIAISFSEDILIHHCYINGSGIHGIWGDSLQGSLTIISSVIEECDYYAIHIENSPNLEEFNIDRSLIRDEGGIDLNGMEGMSDLAIHISNCKLDMPFAPFFEQVYQDSLLHHRSTFDHLSLQASDSTVEAQILQGKELDINLMNWPWKPDTALVHLSTNELLFYLLKKQESEVELQVQAAQTFRVHSTDPIIGSTLSKQSDLSHILEICKGNLQRAELEFATHVEELCEGDSLTSSYVISSCSSPFLLDSQHFPEGKIELAHIERGIDRQILSLGDKTFTLIYVTGQYAHGKWYGQTCSYDLYLQSHRGISYLHHFADNFRYMTAPDLKWAGDLNKDQEIDLWMHLGTAEGKGTYGLFLSKWDKEINRLVYRVSYIYLNEPIC